MARALEAQVAVELAELEKLLVAHVDHRREAEDQGWGSRRKSTFCSWVLTCQLRLYAILPHRPVLIGHRGLGQNEASGHIRHKRHGLVHRIELNGVVQEEEIGLVTGVPFHLTDQGLLALAIHRAQDLLIELAELGLLADPIQGPPSAWSW